MSTIQLSVNGPRIYFLCGMLLYVLVAVRRGSAVEAHLRDQGDGHSEYPMECIVRYDCGGGRVLLLRRAAHSLGDNCGRLGHSRGGHHGPVIYIYRWAFSCRECAGQLFLDGNFYVAQGTRLRESRLGIIFRAAFLSTPMYTRSHKPTKTQHRQQCPQVEYSS
jgi:hypothetical protein